MAADVRAAPLYRYVHPAMLLRCRGRRSSIEASASYVDLQLGVEGELSVVRRLQWNRVQGARRRSSRSRAWGFAVCVGFVVSLAMGAADLATADTTGAEEEAAAEDFFQSELWVPTTSFALTVHDEELDLVGENPVAFSINQSESRTLVALRFGAELMSPVVEALPFEPRFFVAAGVLWSPPGNSVNKIRHATVDVDDYRDFNLPDAVRVFEKQYESNPNNTSDRQADEFEGQGNRVWGRQRHNAWYASVGSVFTFPRSGYSFRVRPTIEYAGEVFDNEGEFALLVDLDPDPMVPDFSVNTIALSNRQTYHSLGPGMELELMNQLDGGVTLSFFMQTRFMWIVNDPGVKLRGDSEDLSGLEFEVERSRFNFRGGMGIRVGFRDLGFHF